MGKIKQGALRRTVKIEETVAGIAFVLLTLYLIQSGLSINSLPKSNSNISHHPSQPNPNPNPPPLSPHSPLPSSQPHLQPHLLPYPHSIPSPKSPLLRHLQQTNNFWDPNSTKSNVYMILLIVGLSILVVGSFVFCVIFIVRYLRNSNHVHQIRNSHMALAGLDPEIIFPQIEYSLFATQIAKPLHENCVICLQTFQPDPCQPSPSHTPPTTTKVSLTICGHLLHTKCLITWIQRQPNCPLCREEFTQENLAIWQNKIHVDFLDVYGVLGLGEKVVEERRRGLRRCDSRENSQIPRQHKIRDSTQLTWLKLYNNRPILNKQRYNKYNINKILNKIPSQSSQSNYQNQNAKWRQRERQRQRQREREREDRKDKWRNRNRVMIASIGNDQDWSPDVLVVGREEDWDGEIRGNRSNSHENLGANTTTNNQPIPKLPPKRTRYHQRQRIPSKFHPNPSSQSYPRPSPISHHQPHQHQQQQQTQANLQTIKIQTPPSSTPPLPTSLTNQELYALVLYTAVMEYHEGRVYLQKGEVEEDYGGRGIGGEEVVVVGQ